MTEQELEAMMKDMAKRVEGDYSFIKYANEKWQQKFNEACKEYAKKKLESYERRQSYW